jgi:hypothetical protein
MASEAIFHWLYQGVVRFEIEDTGEHFPAAIELVRLAGKYISMVAEWLFLCRISESRIRCLAPCQSSRKPIRQRKPNDVYLQALVL